MAINPDEDTEFNDALRKHGILPPKPSKPRTPSPPPPPTLDELLDDYTPAEIKELEDEVQDDETARVMEAFRRRRLAEIRQERRKARFGEVYPIGRDDYKREVTEASEIDEPDDEKMTGKGTGVVCFLYKDGHVPSETAFGHIRALAGRHPRTKFVSIVGDKCIPNYPDRNLPTIFVYRSGEITTQQIAWGVAQERHLEDLEAVLILSGAIIPPERPLPPDHRAADQDHDEDLSDDESVSRMRSSQPHSTRAGPRRQNVRGAAKTRVEDDDSDFDL